MFIKSLLSALVVSVASAGNSYYDTPEVCQNSILGVLKSQTRFSTLVTAIETAGLVSTLNRGLGPFTLFAPTNNAFVSSLGEDGIDELLRLPRARLSDILLYHVLPRNLPREDVREKSYDTVQGDDIEIGFNRNEVLVNDKAEIVTFDLCASNGFVHAIDEVLVLAGPAIADNYTPPQRCTGKGKGKGFNGS